MCKYKNYLAYILIVLITGCASKKATNTKDLANLELKGPVKSIKSQSFYAKDSVGYVVKTFKGKGYSDFAYQDVIINFNASGSILKKTELSEYGEEEKRIENEYNQDAKIIIQNTYDDGNLASKTEYTYYEGGKLKTEREEYSYTDAHYLTSYQYNDFGNPILITRKEINEKDTVTTSNKKLTHQYNEKGIRTETYIYWSEEETKIKYDAKGNVIFSEIVKGYQDMILPKHTYTYNDQNLLVKESNYYSSQEFAFANHFTYNKDELIIEEGFSTEKDATPLKKKEISYNQNGQLVKQLSFDQDGNLEETVGFVYKNDKNGNWTQRIMFVNGKPNTIVEREIIYYK